MQTYYRHFWEDNSRFAGVPKKVGLSKNMKFAVTPLVLIPVVPLQSM